MSLDWNVSRVKNADAVCWEVATETDTMRGREKGESYLSPLTETIIWCTMIVDMGEITEKNADEFYRRIHAWEAQCGAFLHRGKVERPITLDDVKAHVGLFTNVSTKRAAAFDRKLRAKLAQLADRKEAAARAK